jgi:type VI protein secretion system component VasF
MQGPTARKTAHYAEQNAGQAMDLSNQSSGVDLSGATSKAMTGDWIGAGLALVGALGGWGVNRHFSKKRISQTMALAEEVAELPPEQARERLKSKKV